MSPYFCPRICIVMNTESIWLNNVITVLSTAIICLCAYGISNVWNCSLSNLMIGVTGPITFRRIYHQVHPRIHSIPLIAFSYKTIHRKRKLSKMSFKDNKVISKSHKVKCHLKKSKYLHILKLEHLILRQKQCNALKTSSDRAQLPTGMEYKCCYRWNFIIAARLNFAAILWFSKDFSLFNFVFGFLFSSTFSWTTGAHWL